MRAGKAVSRRYRNRRIGEFLKELDLTEGRSTGLPKILKVMRANGSPAPEFESGEDRTHLLIRLLVHPRAVIQADDGAQSGAQSEAQSGAQSGPSQAHDEPDEAHVEADEAHDESGEAHVVTVEAHDGAGPSQDQVRTKLGPSRGLSQNRF